jgi:hypothetical protein
MILEVVRVLLACTNAKESNASIEIIHSCGVWCISNQLPIPNTLKSRLQTTTNYFKK